MATKIQFSRWGVAEQANPKQRSWGLSPVTKTRRTQLDIIVEILQVALLGVSKTALVYRSNLNFVVVKKYLRLLQKKGLLELVQSNGRSLYKTTTKGAQAMQAISGTICLISEEQPSP